MISAAMERMTPEADPVAAPPAEVPAALRGAPPPRDGGPLTLLRFLRRKRMLNHRYALLFARLAFWKLRHRGRLVLDGLAFIGPGCALQIGRKGRLELGRWSWIGHGCKLRCHEGVISIGAKTVLGQECTISAYQHVSIGRECVIADRTMFIDFDHGMVDVERPIRVQGIYKRDVRVGNNVWIGYGACVLRGVTVGDNAVIGTNAVVTRDIPPNAVAAGVPARVIRMREEPEQLRWS
jgi:acetyltransferase-like isoleucine patch superfamily enzyme